MKPLLSATPARGNSSTGSELKAVEEAAVRLLERSNHERGFHTA
jgi:hypothetical protein